MMVIAKYDDIVFDDYYFVEPTDEQLENTMFSVNERFPNLSDGQRVVLDFNEIKQWFETWDQSNETKKYDNVYDYIRAGLNNEKGLSAILSTDAMEYITELVSNVTDGDPLADITEDEALDYIREAQYEYGYSIPLKLTPALFVEIYNDLKPEE